MTNAGRARSTSFGEWDRARRAYGVLISGHDPVAALIASMGALDLRPGGDAAVPAADRRRTIVSSGPADLIELREIVEIATGVGTWPIGHSGPGETHTALMPVERGAPLLGLLLAMEGLIDDRSPWRTWRSAIDTVASRVERLETVTIEAVVSRPTD